jgi:two-component system cell cycle sensor histidine kinase/response regulator CckA
LSGPVVLIVEDNAVTRKMMRLTLQAEGYEVLEAQDGQTALRRVAEEAPALVILSCVLPDMDGFEVGRRMGKMAPSLPVVAVTGWTPAVEARVLAAGFLDVLVKPVDASRLVEVVERHLGRPSSQPPRTDRSVVLADDDPIQRRLAQLALTTAGFEVLLAADGKDALRLVAQRRPDVVISDVLMPRMDGFALCKAMRTDPNLAKIPVVLMSAHYMEDEDRELATRFGASRYVSRSGGFDSVVRAALDVISSPTPETIAVPSEALQSEHLSRIAHQLERQASIGLGLARRVSLQASALSLLDGLSDALAKQRDPESALGGTLSTCLDATGLSFGAILLRGDGGQLALTTSAGTKHDPGVAIDWTAHTGLLDHAIRRGGLVMPSNEAGIADAAGHVLLKALGMASALIVPIIARDEPLGALLLAAVGDDLAGADGESAVRAVRAVAMQLGQALALSRMFAKLASTEQRYRALLENAHDGIAIMSPEGVLLELNRRGEEIMGLARGQGIGQHIAAFAPAAVTATNAATYGKMIANGGGFAPPLAVARPDGTTVQVEFSSTVVDLGGERFVFAIGRDVTERLRLEDQLRQSQKMEAVGLLAGGIAHDFNNVLSVVLSYGDLLLAEMKPGEPMREDVEEIRKAGKRAAALTRQLLMFSRQQVIAPKVLDLNEVLTGMDRMLQYLVGADVELVSLPKDGLGRVRIDPGGMEQVIMNLVVNARDAMPDGGTLTMETANIVLGEEYAREHHGVKAGPHVMLAVTDTGIGMDRATQARIFEPFYTTKPIGKGTGLGLSTVFGIVQQSEGSIWVYSEPGQGTTFKVYLPRVDAAVDSVPPGDASADARGSETILLVEDDDQVRRVARDILLKGGYRVLEARNAGEAMLHSEKHGGAIDLLLTDVVMPQMSGIDLAKRLTTPRPEMRLLCMSGYTDDSVVRKGILKSNIAFVQKPFTPAALTGKVREVLDERPSANMKKQREWTR